MAKKKNKMPSKTPQASDTDKPATLRDLLDAGTLSKLKAQAEALKEEEARQREQKRQAEEAARQAEQKKLENDFEHLLNNSSQDWKKYK